jgi:hypothetical protein
MKWKKTNDPMLARLDRFTERTGKMVTKHPVFFEVRNFGRGEERTAAMLEEYEKPKEYVVTLSPKLIRGCKERHSGPVCERELKKIIAHEIAHINAPDEHGRGFRAECARLGGGNRCKPRGARDLYPRGSRR